MTTLEDELKEHISTLKQQLNPNGEVVWDKQVGGSHYQNFTIQPAEFVNKNKLLFAEGNAIKYICRAGYKSSESKEKDLKKAIHYLENELKHTTLQIEQSERSSNSIPFSLWDPEQFGEPDYATGFDR